MANIDLKKALNYNGRDRLPGYEWDRLRRKILARDDYLCVECGDPAEEVDHIIPVALGGTDTPRNLQSLCEKCHKKKTAEDIEKVKRTRRFKKYKNRIGGGFE